MTVAARGDKRPLGEGELLTRLIDAAHDSVENNLSQAEVDALLGVDPPEQAS